MNSCCLLKKIFFTCVIAIILVASKSFLSINESLLSAKGDENFLVQKRDVTRKMSKNDLKENIGQQVRDVLHECAELNKQVGKIQVQLSEIEQQLFEKIEKLIDNKPPFKKASHGNLADSFKILSGVRKELQSQVERVSRLSLEIDKNSCLKKTT